MHSLEAKQPITAKADHSGVRAKVVRLLEIIYWLLIFEGALRKWLLVPLAKPLFFIRDPFVLYVYYLAWKHNLFPTKNPLFRLSIALAIGFVGLFVFQAAIDRVSLATGIYGWRMYFWLMPLAFLAGDLLSGADLKSIVKQTMAITVLMAAIVLLQYKSPPTSFINRMIESDTAFVYGEVARASGTFSFTQGHELFCHTAVAMLVAILLMPAKFRLFSGKMMILIGLSTIVNVLLDGNRGVLILAGIVMLTSLVYRIFIAKMRFSWRTFLPELVCAGSFIIYVLAFPTAYEGMSSRIAIKGDDGSKNEGSSRMVGIFTSVGDAVQRSRVSGGGIGLGTSGGRALTPARPGSDNLTYFDENELGRVIDECGPLGLLYIVYRAGLAVYLMVFGFLASKRTRNPLPLLLATFPAWILLCSHLTFNGTTNGYGWLFVGFSLAANRMGLPRNNTTNAAAGG